MRIHQILICNAWWDHDFYVSIIELDMCLVVTRVIWILSNSVILISVLSVTSSKFSQLLLLKLILHDHSWDNLERGSRIFVFCDLYFQTHSNLEVFKQEIDTLQLLLKLLSGLLDAVYNQPTYERSGTDARLR